MNVPNFIDIRVVNEDGTFTDEWRNIMQSFLQAAQLNLGNEGYVVPSISSDPNSVNPPAAGGELLQVQNNVNIVNGITVNTCQPGTVIFDPYEQNGAILPARNGQLKVLLNDGVFHLITNT